MKKSRIAKSYNGAFAAAREQAIKEAAQLREERKREKDRLAALASEKNKIYSEPNPKEFIDQNRSGFTAEDIAADLAVLEVKKANIAETNKKETGNATAEASPDSSLQEAVVARELRTLFPQEYVTRIYPASEVDDVLNGVDLVCELEKRDGTEPPLRFAVDVTYKNDEKKILKKLRRSSHPGKAAVPSVDSPDISEFGRLTTDPESGKTKVVELEKDETIPSLIGPGIANLKYFKDSKGQPTRLSIPKVVLALQSGGFKSEESGKIDHELNQEHLIYQLRSQLDDSWASLYTRMFDRETMIIDQDLEPVVKETKALMDLVADMDEQHAADPSRTRKRRSVRRDTLKYGGNQSLSSRIVSLSHKVFPLSEKTYSSDSEASDGSPEDSDPTSLETESVPVSLTIPAFLDEK